MSIHRRRDKSKTLRDWVEMAAYRELQPMMRQGAVRLRTATAALGVVALLVGAGGYWLGVATGDDPNPAPPSGLASGPTLPPPEPAPWPPPPEPAGATASASAPASARAIEQPSEPIRPRPEPAISRPETPASAPTVEPPPGPHPPDLASASASVSAPSSASALGRPVPESKSAP